jgi:hypothetical protein
MSVPADPDRLLSKLLGPESPELSCEECFDLMDRYVELELAQAEPDEQIPGMRAHLQGCPACCEDREALHAYLAQENPGAG